MDVSKKISLFVDFLEKYYLALIKSKKNKFIEIDFSLLLKFNSELADHLLEDPEETIKCIQIAVKELNDTVETQVLINNLPESTYLPLNEISDQLDRFLSFDGYVMKPSDIHLKCKSAKWECPSCGNIINNLMLGKEWKEPSRCGCGRKGKFKLLNKELIRFQRIEILEALDEIPDKPIRLIKKSVFLDENLTRKDINRQLQPGQRVKIHGFLELEELRSRGSKYKSNEFKTNIIANNIIPIENSWESIKLTKYQIEKLKEMAKNKKLLDEFSQSIAPNFEGYDLIRKSLILQHVGGKRILDSNRNLEERGVIHVLMSGDPGSGKSYLMRRSLKISPLWNWTTGKGMTKVGLVACVVKDEYGNNTLEVGPLVMSDKGIIGIDEMEKMNKEDFGILNNAMAEEQTKITKANIDQTLRTRTCVLATSNPFHKEFVDNDTIMKQLAPIPKDILDRFDILWPMRENIDQKKLEEKYMARHISEEKIKQTWSNEEIRNYITYAKRITPLLSIKIAKYFNEKFRKLTGKTTKEVGEDSKSHRLRGNILRWAYAHSKFVGIGKENKDMEVEIEKSSIDFAFVLMRHSFNLLNLISEEGFVKYEDIEEIPKKKEVNKFYTVKNLLQDLAKQMKNKVPENEIIKLAEKEGVETEEVYEILDKLKQTGDCFEPRKSIWGMI